MLRGFKEFITRGNLIELAVAFVIGASFATVVKTFTDMLLALIGKLGGNPNFDRYQPGDIPVGAFLTALVAFLIVAAVVYFFVVVPYNKLRERQAAGIEPTPPAEEITLLAEIRDLLATRQGSV
jgi:large conductance mechanosensitive channel